MQNKKDIEAILISKLDNGDLPAHAHFWDVKEFSKDQKVEWSELYNSHIQPDLCYKPISTFFALRNNNNE